MKIYIAGPMTGYENYNREAFNDKAETLMQAGHTTINPEILPDGLSQAEYMDICFAMIRAADAILLLKGFKESLGAMAELAYAKKLGLEIYEEQKGCVNDTSYTRVAPVYRKFVDREWVKNEN